MFSFFHKDSNFLTKKSKMIIKKNLKNKIGHHMGEICYHQVDLFYVRRNITQEHNTFLSELCTVNMAIYFICNCLSMPKFTCASSMTQLRSKSLIWVFLASVMSNKQPEHLQLSFNQIHG